MSSDDRGDFKKDPNGIYISQNPFDVNQHFLENQFFDLTKQIISQFRANIVEKKLIIVFHMAYLSRSNPILLAFRTYDLNLKPLSELLIVHLPSYLHPIDYRLRSVYSLTDATGYVIVFCAEQKIYAFMYHPNNKDLIKIGQYPCNDRSYKTFKLPKDYAS